MAEKKIHTAGLYVVNASFFYKNDQLFTAGQVVAAGHPVLKGRQHLFRPVVPVGEPEPVEVAPKAEPDAAGPA